MYDPLYNENIGLGGFRCRDCRRVTRTERGMKSHMWSVHGQKVQLELYQSVEQTAGAIRPATESEQRDDRGGDCRAIVVYLGDPYYTEHTPECRSNIGFGTLPCDCGGKVPAVRRKNSEES